MKRDLILIPTKGMTRAEWLAERRKSIGGSDAAAIVGLNPYATQYTVWADKTGRLPDKPDSEAMRQGRDFEQYVADRFTELTGKKTRKVNAIIKNPAYPWASANIDRDVVGESAGLECKTTSVMNLRKFKGGEFPSQYYVQCCQYMAIMGNDRWFLAVLVLNQGFMVYQLTRIENDDVPEWCSGSVYISDDEITALMEAEKAFWKLVKSDIPPAFSGTQADSDALAAIYKGDEGNDAAVSLFGRDGEIDRYFEISDRIKELETQRDKIKQTLQGDLGDQSTGTTENYKVTWRQQTRSSFDAKRFAEENPDFDLSGYYKQSTFRKFDIRRL